MQPAALNHKKVQMDMDGVFECGVYEVTLGDGSVTIGLAKKLVKYSNVVFMSFTGDGVKNVTLTNLTKVKKLHPSGKYETLVECLKGKTCELFPQVPLGVGTQGSVFVGMYHGKPVAVKKVIGNSENLKNEIQILEEMDHDNILSLHDRNKDVGPLTYLVTELADASLYDIFSDADSLPLPLDKIVTYSCHMLRGLSYLHSKGYVHKDMKPQNLLWFSEAELLKLCDFGVSVKVDEGVSTSAGYTREYAAPERGDTYNSTACYGAVYDKYADIFGAGVIMLEMFIGTEVKTLTPYDYLAELEKIYKENKINETFYEVIKRALQLEPCMRPSADELLDIIEGRPSRSLKQTIEVYLQPVQNTWKENGQYYMKGYELGRLRQVSKTEDFPWDMHQVLPSQYYYNNDEDPDMRFLRNGGQHSQFDGNDVFMAYAFSSGEGTRLSYTLDPSEAVPYDHADDEANNIPGDMLPMKIGTSGARFLIPVSHDKVLLLFGERPTDAHENDMKYTITYSNVISVMSHIARQQLRANKPTDGYNANLRKLLNNSLETFREGGDERLAWDVEGGCLLLENYSHVDVIPEGNPFKKVDMKTAKKIPTDQEAGTVLEEPAHKLVKHYRKGTASSTTTSDVTFDSFTIAALCVTTRNKMKKNVPTALLKYEVGNEEFPLPFSHKSHPAKLWDELHYLLMLFVREDGMTLKDLRLILSKLQGEDQVIMQHVVPMICHLDDDKGIPLNELFPDSKPSFLRMKHVMNASSALPTVKDPINPQICRAERQRLLSEEQFAKSLKCGRDSDNKLHLFSDVKVPATNSMVTVLQPFSDVPVKETRKEGDLLVTKHEDGTESRMWYKVGEMQNRTAVLKAHYEYNRINIIADFLRAHGLDLAWTGYVTIIPADSYILEATKQYNDSDLLKSSAANALAGVMILHLYLNIDLKHIHNYQKVHRIQYVPFAESQQAVTKDSLQGTDADREKARYYTLMAFILLSTRYYALRSPVEIGKARAENKEKPKGHQQSFDKGVSTLMDGYDAFKDKVDAFLDDVAAPVAH